MSSWQPCVLGPEGPRVGLWVKYVNVGSTGEVGPGHPRVRVRASRPSWLTHVNAGPADNKAWACFKVGPKTKLVWIRPRFE
jgi:hypothetical protein